MLKFLKYIKAISVLKIFIIMFFLSGIASAQIPDKFKNLKILPKDISKKELISTMKSFTNALGVRCYYCHVAKEERDFKTYDFASDEKTKKGKARIMMEMVHHINTEHLSKLKEYSEHVMKVNCLTCHHGQNEPKLLQNILFKVVNKKGLEAGLTKYKKLRKQYYGGFTYDFQVGTLANFNGQINKS